MIRCWDEGLVGLKTGAKAKFICPPHYGYGDRGMGPIPAGSALLFDIEVVSIEPQEEKPDEPRFTVDIKEEGEGYQL